MHVEELLLKIRDNLASSKLAYDLSEWHRNFVLNICGYVEEGNPLSTRQSEVVLKMFSKIRPSIIALGLITGQEIDSLLAHPSYLRPLYESSNVRREVRHLGDNLLAFRFKKDDSIRERLKSVGNPLMTAWLDGSTDAPRYLRKTDFVVALKSRFDWDYKLWIVPVYRFNLKEILSIISTGRFGLDQSTSDYLHLAKNSFDKPSVFALDPTNDVLIANVPDNPLLAGWITEAAGGMVL